MGNLCLELERRSNQQLNFKPQFLGPRNCLPAWREIGASQTLLKAISNGVKAPLIKAPLVQSPKARQEEAMQATIGEYLASGAIRRLSPNEKANTRSWTPIFGLEKKQSNKIRVITDLRNLNRCCQPFHHKPETWKSVLLTLQDPNLKWATKLDLQSWYHNLAVHPKTARWMRFHHLGVGYQIQAMPFGWNLSSMWSHLLSQPVRSHIQQMGIKLAWFVDDILILGHTKSDAEQKTAQVIHLLTRLGLRINEQKSSTEARQVVEYLGQILDLTTNTLSPVPEKREASHRAAKLCLRGRRAPARFVARVAGMLLEQRKSNPALHGYPQQIMRCAAQMAATNLQQGTANNRFKAWNAPTFKSPELQDLLKEASHCLQSPIPRVFRATTNLRYQLNTDASDLGWGATLKTQGKEVKAAGLPWTNNQKGLHSTHKEALATALAVKFLAPYIPEGSHLELNTDSSSTMWLWNKGSRIRSLNNTIWRQVQELHKKKIFCVARHVPGVTNKRADWLSRNLDPKNYRLNPAIFQQVCQHFQAQPTIDLFASRQNKQVQRYCSWRVDPKSQGSAWDILWGKEMGWCNPPWELIRPTLAKIKQDKAKVLCCLPDWGAQPWYPEMLALQVTRPLILKDRPLFQDPSGNPLPPPRWRTLFCILQG